MSIVEDVLSECSSEFERSIESLKVDFGKLRTGRANLAILDGVRVDYYGSQSPLSQCANLIVADARLILVKPWDKAIINDIEKAIQKADIGITPQNDGMQIRLPIPALTEDRRKDIVKQAKQRGEECKISLRNHRRDANEMLKEAEKDKDITEDELKRALDKVQQITDAGTKNVDEVFATKESEILEI